jgi:DNA cross-link repair 1A protein
MAAKSASKSFTPKSRTTNPQPRQTQTTLVPSTWGKKSNSNGPKTKPKATPNGNIISFFKKAEEQNNRIFLQEKVTSVVTIADDVGDDEVGWAETTSATIDVKRKQKKHGIMRTVVALSAGD